MYSDRLQEMQSLTHEKITEIIRHSIDLYYQKITGEHTDAPKKLLKSRLIGCADGEPSLSKNYKSVLGLSLVRKYAHR